MLATTIRAAHNRRARPMSFQDGLTDPPQSQSALRVRRSELLGVLISGVKCQPYLQFSNYVKSIPMAKCLKQVCNIEAVLHMFKLG